MDLNLRDYFAGQALAGMLSNTRLTDGSGNFELRYMRDAYKIADDMLKARVLNDTPQNVDTNTIADTLACYGSASCSNFGNVCGKCSRGKGDFFIPITKRKNKKG